LAPKPTKAQATVALSPVPAQQFFSQAGAPLAGGCVYTFISGTSTQLATYTDGTGATQNANPVILDAGGFGNLWLTNSSYRFQIWSFGSGAVGSNCGNGTLQRTVDNVSAYTIINQAQNIFLSGNTVDPTGTAGELTYRTDIPCFRAFTTFWDCLVRLTDTQTLTNKTMDASLNTFKNTPNTAGHYLRNNGSQYVDANLSQSDIQQIYTVSATLAATANGLVKLTTDNPSRVTGTLTSDLSSVVIGICLSSCTVGSSASVQSTGIVSCNFDGATTVGDYVTISPTVATDCRDNGTNVSASFGRVLSTNAGAGLYQILFTGAVLPTGFKVEGVTVTPVTVANTNAQAALQTLTIPAGDMGLNQMFYFEGSGTLGDTGPPTIQVVVFLDSLGGTILANLQPTLVAGSGFNWTFRGYFVVTTLGSGTNGKFQLGGAWWGSNPNGGGFTMGCCQAVGNQPNIDTTISHTIIASATWSAASASNTITQNHFLIYRVN
jgi:hypothetical protein